MLVLVGEAAGWELASAQRLPTKCPNRHSTYLSGARSFQSLFRLTAVLGTGRAGGTAFTSATSGQGD